MHASHQIKDNRPAPDAGIGPKMHMALRVTITTDGSWFTVHGDTKADSGFDLHFSTDGGNAELTIHAHEGDFPPPVLRPYCDRPA